MIIKELKGGSLSKTVVMEEEGVKFVRKFISKNIDREYGLVRWQSQIRKHQVMSQAIGSENLPKILSLGFQNDSYYYDIEYLENSKNFLHYLLEPYDGVNVESAFERLFDVIGSYKRTSFGAVKGSFSLYIQEEIVSVLKRVLIESERKVLSFKEFNGVKELCTEAFGLIESNADCLNGIELVETLTHGNLTLENTMIDTVGRIKLIDLYAETYCESWLGDVSQIMQSCIGNYELINNLDENAFSDLFTEVAIYKSASYDEFKYYLNDFISKFSHEDKFVLEVFYASQFIRMFPFKIDKTPRKAFYFIIKGLRVLNEALKKC
jgi:hypothetical protein